MARICITGIWHQGAVLAACLADLGHEVQGVCDERSATRLADGRPLVEEPLLPELLRGNVAAGRLEFTADLAAGVDGAEFAFISTDTPVGPDDEPELDPIYELARAIGAAQTGDIALCVTAQVPVGTTEALANSVREGGSGFRCDAAYVPEFLRLGTAVESFRAADRFVIGAADDAVAERVHALFAPLGRPIMTTDVRSAEMAKHAANAFLATSVSFINEIADISAAVGADALEVVRALKLDRRIGAHAYLQPGLGFTGGTLARELRALQQIGNDRAIATRLLDAVLDVNSRRVALVRRTLADNLGSLAGARVALAGLTYKAGTNTLRRTAALDIARDLVDHGASVVAHDPLVERSEISVTELALFDNLEDAASGADAVAFLTDWDGSRLDFVLLGEAMRGELVVDARMSLDRARVEAAGLRYARLGAASQQSAEALA
jgi:UDPglucose 6-dehydrogenase